MINWIKKFLTQLRQRNIRFNKGDQVKDIYRPKLGVGRVIEIVTTRAIYQIKVQYGPNTYTHYTTEGKYWADDYFISLRKV